MLPKELAKVLGAPRNVEGFSVGPLVDVIGQRLDHSDFTKSSTTGYKVLTKLLPANAIVIGAFLNVTEAFVGDTTGTIEIGTVSDRDRFSPATDISVYTAGRYTLDPKNPADVGDGITMTVAEEAVYVTITGTADWDNVSAGAMDVFLVYVHVPVESCE